MGIDKDYYAVNCKSQLSLTICCVISSVLVTFSGTQWETDFSFAVYMQRAGWRGRQPFFNSMFLLNIGKEIQYTSHHITTQLPIKPMWAFMQDPGRDTVSKNSSWSLVWYCNHQVGILRLWKHLQYPSVQCLREAIIISIIAQKSVLK